MKSVSVIIPAKNEEQYIAECLRALRQSIDFFEGIECEIILVDNGSTDKTREIASSFGCKVLHEPDVESISRLRNIGAHHAKNEIICFLDADCLVAQQWMSICVDVLKHNEDIGIIGTPAVPDLTNSTWVEQSLYLLMAGSASRADFVKWLGTSNLFVYKFLFERVGGFDESLITSEDVNFCYAIAIKENKLIYLEKRINTIHTRESKTLGELFKREFWRGKNSLVSLVNNKFSRDEILSVLVPAAILFSFFLIIFGTVFSLPMITLASLSLIFLLPVIFMVKKKVPLFSFFDVLRYYIISYVYLIARACSLAVECVFLFGFLWGKKNERR